VSQSSSSASAAVTTPLQPAPDPAPLGLAAFAMANLIQAFFATGINPSLNQAAFPLELLTGGLAQLIAGIAEFRQGNRLGATAFTLYGTYWAGFALYIRFILPTLPAGEAHSGTGFFLLPWGVLTLVLTLAALRTTGALLAAFVCATLSYCFLTPGEFVQSTVLIQIGGGFGFLTAAVGLYAALAGLVNGTWGRHLLPTFPDPGRRLAHLARNKARPLSITSSAGETDLAREAAELRAELGRRHV
jgi:uncharacterized protein